MPDLTMLNDTVRLLLGLAAIAALVVGWFRKGRPWLKQRREEREAISEVLLGREAIPANRITGEGPKPAKPSIGQLVADIHHELHPNNGSSMKDALTRTENAVTELRAMVETMDLRQAAADRRFERIEHVLHDELHTVNDALANTAEAAATLLPVIDHAIKAQPPAADPVEPPADLD